VRFARELESVLGGAEYVVETYRAWTEVSESEASQIDRKTAMTAAHWPMALNAATRAAFRNLGDVGDARFVVLLERHIKKQRRRHERREPLARHECP
jgi:hypothetical protein